MVFVQRPASLLVTMLAGQDTTGVWLSVTVTVKGQLERLPEASVARKVTLVTPGLKATLLMVPATKPTVVVAPVSW